MTADFTSLLETFRQGKFIIVYDEFREQEGDFFVLAEYITPEKINFLLANARGMICVACEPAILDRLKIPLMVEKNNNPHGTNFCISLDAAKNITTGVSAYDRAETIRLLADPKTKKSNLVIPGHTFPLRAEKNYEKRFGHTEAAVKLSKKCGALPVVVICEILNAKGKKANERELKKISKKYDIPMTSLKDIYQSD